MKPVGLIDPRTGKMPYAVVQLRQENLRADSYNLVGFQNHLKFGEQARVLRLIPGLENARFLRYGQIHRNTYINAPTLLCETLQMKSHPRVLFAGQICRVEGFMWSRLPPGSLAGMHAAALVSGSEIEGAPRASRLRLSDSVRNPCGCQKFSAGEYHFRSAARAGEEDSRPAKNGIGCSVKRRCVGIRRVDGSGRSNHRARLKSRVAAGLLYAHRIPGVVSSRPAFLLFSATKCPSATYQTIRLPFRGITFAFPRPRPTKVL